LSAEIQQRFPNAQVTLVPQGKGIFDVSAQGVLVYAKYATGRFPQPGEVS